MLRDLKVRQDYRILNQAFMIAIGMRNTGERGVLGFSLGASEEHDFSHKDTGTVWMDFLRRGQKDVRLVTSDAHESLKAATHEALAGATWQRCQTHSPEGHASRPKKCVGEYTCENPRGCACQIRRRLQHAG